MEIAILMDELSQFQPILRKAVSNKAVVEQIRFFSPLEQPEPSFLYLYQAKSSTSEENSWELWPKHLIAPGSRVIPPTCIHNAETVIEVADTTDPVKLYQVIANSLASFNDWRMSMLLAILQNRNINEFLDIAAQKLANPIALFDSELALIAKTGEFRKPYTGTIWEKVVSLGYSPTEFYTMQEQQEISNTVASAIEPYLFHTSKDKNHTYAAAHVWIDGKMHFSLGSVDINSPFTDGQVCIIKHITEGLKLFIQNDDIYKQLSNSAGSFVVNLLQGIQVEEKRVAYYLSKLNWKIKDHFCLMNILSPIPLDSPVPSLSYVKRVHDCFPESLITIYHNSIIVIVRVKDYPVEAIFEHQDFRQLLNNCGMICGISVNFSNFMNLKYYYAQSSFAIDYCKQRPDSVIQNYEECYAEHLLQAIDNSSDLQEYCHPLILEMRESGKKNQLELIHTLYVYLLNGRNIALTSEALFIHRNTLIYRIDKISGLLNIDLKILTSEQVFYLLFSCMIVEHL